MNYYCFVERLPASYDSFWLGFYRKNGSKGLWPNSRSFYFTTEGMEVVENERIGAVKNERREERRKYVIGEMIMKRRIVDLLLKRASRASFFLYCYHHWQHLLQISLASASMKRFSTFLL